MRNEDGIEIRMQMEAPFHANELNNGDIEIVQYSDYLKLHEAFVEMRTDNDYMKAIVKYMLDGKKPSSTEVIAEADRVRELEDRNSVLEREARKYRESAYAVAKKLDVAKQDLQRMTSENKSLRAMVESMSRVKSRKFDEMVVSDLSRECDSLKERIRELEDELDKSRRKDDDNTEAR